jgi:hypothetical protein
MVKAVFAGSDYRSRDEIRTATSASLRRRNAEARRAATPGGPPGTAGGPVEQRLEDQPPDHKQRVMTYK